MKLFSTSSIWIRLFNMLILIWNRIYSIFLKNLPNSNLPDFSKKNLESHILFPHTHKSLMLCPKVYIFWYSNWDSKWSLTQALLCNLDSLIILSFLIIKPTKIIVRLKSNTPAIFKPMIPSMGTANGRRTFFK